MNRLEGRVAVITGAARGIGLGIAERMAEEGAKLLLVDILEADLQKAAQKIVDNGGKVQTIALDLTAKDAPARVAQALRDAYGHLDILVNNAGIGIGGTIEDFSDEEWDHTLAVNLTAPFRLSRELVPIMAARGYGRVINISSMNGSMGMRNDAGYSATKAGVEALTRSIAADYGRHGVTANCIAPGTIVTPLNRDILANQPPSAPMVKIVVINKPIPGDGEPADIAATAAFLAAEESKFVSAQIIQVDGGLTGTRYVPDEEGTDGQVRYLPKN